MPRLINIALAAVTIASVIAPTDAEAGRFDGRWQVTRTSTECAHKGKTFTILIVDGRIGGPRYGRVDGRGRFVMAFRNRVKHYRYHGQLGARSGTCRWSRRMFNGNMNCGGRLKLWRIG